MVKLLLGQTLEAAGLDSEAAGPDFSDAARLDSTDGPFGPDCLTAPTCPVFVADAHMPGAGWADVRVDEMMDLRKSGARIPESRGFLLRRVRGS